MKNIVLGIFLFACILGLCSGCTTMNMPPFPKRTAESCEFHLKKDGVTIGIHPITDKSEIMERFEFDLPSKGLLQILFVVYNQNDTSSFIIDREKILVANAAGGPGRPSQRKEVTAEQFDNGHTCNMVGGILTSLLFLPALPLACYGGKLMCDTIVIEYNLGDKEFYSRTLDPGQSAQGYIYFQYPPGGMPAGDYHVKADLKDSATGQVTPFNLPFKFTP